MNSIIDLARSAAIGLVALGFATAGAAAQEDLPLKRVMLSTGGVGYYEHEASVEGDAELSFQVRLDQVDDVLKSVVVYDDRGGVGTVRLPGQQPLREVFRNLPFEPGALASPVALLNALQGAEIDAVGARSLRGRLLRVTAEQTQLPDGAGTVTRHRVTLLTAEGLQHLIFEEAESLRFTDPELQAQVEQALLAIADNRVRDRRTLTVSLQGEGRRTVRVGYVVEAPLWKTAYRLTLPAQELNKDTGRLQGWAVVENLSGQDWSGVELTLLSGNPVTFRQALYSAYYVPRPEIPVEVLGRVLPRVDTGEVAAFEQEDAGGRALRDEKRERQRASADRAMAKSELAAQLPAPTAPGGAGGMLANEPATAPAIAAAATGTEAATQVIFTYPKPVAVRAGESLMVPIVDREVDARRLSLYQPDTHALHPLASVELVNDSGSGLPPGVLTLYEQGGTGGSTAYVGDARLAPLPDGEERLVSFALDQKVRIDREEKSERTVVGAAADRGVLRLRVVQRQSTAYRVKGAAKEARKILIEVPRRAGWELAEPDAKEVALTESHYRVEREIAAGASAAFGVTLERKVVESVRIGDLPRPQIEAYARSDELGAEARKAFQEIAERHRRLDELERTKAGHEEDRARIFEEQKRIRDNLGRVPRESDLYRRYLTKLDEQETELEGMLEAIEEVTVAIAEARRELDAYIAALKI